MKEGREEEKEGGREGGRKKEMGARAVARWYCTCPVWKKALVSYTGTHKALL